MGRRSISVDSYSKLSVLVPSHFHVPGKEGSNWTGTSCADSAPSVPSGTMGWLKVTLTKGARGISPSGAKRTTSSGPASTGAGVATTGGGGNGSLTVSPGRGGGRDCSGSRNSTWSWGSAGSTGSRAKSCAISSAVNGSP